MIDRRRNTLRGVLVATATALALALTAQNAAATGGAAPAGETRTPSFSMKGVHRQTAEPYLYFTDRAGGFAPGRHVAVGYGTFADSVDVDNDRDGWSDGTWNLYKDGTLDYSWIDDRLAYHSKQVGTGWDTYTEVLSPGNLGGAREADLVGRDGDGVLWLHLARPDGTLTARHRVGGGWGRYTQLAGQGDLTGDGRPDVVARDGSGVLWLHRGTGDRAQPFAPRTRVGGGWNAYDRLLSVGDLDADGTPDLIARTPDGVLLRYSGTGTDAEIFAEPVVIGRGYHVYDLL
ncbi:FG-GAP repeat domain-containing protein [Streptomyces genisteinicus]|uniref:VCBS repeat-containing protein n=1 Tax=Streptomyces genisteinicus TaxID=2768068 RepID=A0A7H0HM01_9ACTN|nr:VCBS repeat-containing protein [Streptomyces genisteinicus]QNP61567.1 VCBS repeat-containing protein [Streptomyces genisteinicus]